MSAAAAVSFAASPTQDQIWVEDQLDPDACGYNEAGAVRIRAPLDIGRLRAAIDVVVARHPMLRACVRLDGNRLIQSVIDTHRPELYVEHGFAALPADRREREALAWASSLAEQPLRPDAAPPYRWALARFATDDHLLLFVTHQVLLDGVSMYLVLDEVLARWSADDEPILPQTDDRYADFAAYHRQMLAAGRLDAEIDHLADLLGTVPALRLPPDPDCTGARHRFGVEEISRPSAALVRRYASQVRATPFQVMLAAFAAQMYHYSGQERFWLGIGMARRPPGYEDTLGTFASVVPIGFEFSPGTSFAEAVAATAEECLLAMAGRDLVPMTAVLNKLRVSRDATRPSLTTVVFNAPPQWVPSIRDGQATVAQVPRRRARFDLLMMAYLGVGGLTTVVEADGMRFCADSANEFAVDFGTALDWLLAHDREPLAELGRRLRRPMAPRPGSSRPAADGHDTDDDHDGHRDDEFAVGVDDDSLRVARVLADVYSEVLSQPTAVNEDFFVLGGDSIAAATVADRISHELDVDVTLRAIFEHPAPIDLALALIRRHPGLPEAVRISAELTDQELSDLLGPDDAPVEEDGIDDGQGRDDTGTPRDGQPLTGVQRAFWMLEQVAPAHCIDTTTILFPVAGGLDPAALRLAFTTVVARHDALRATVVGADDGPRWRVVPDPVVDVRVIDMSATPVAQWPAASLARAKDLARQGFHLHQAPLHQLLVLDGPGSACAVVLRVHHVIVDYLSNADTILPELEAAYRAEVTGETTRFGEVAPRHRAVPRRSRREEAVYWARQLTGVDLLQLPTDHPRPPNWVLDGVTLGTVVPADVVERLRRVAAAEQCSLFMVCTAAAFVMLHRWSGASDLQMLTPATTRDPGESAAHVGCMINTVVLRVDFARVLTWRRLLHQVRQVVLDAYQHSRISVEDALAAAGAPPLVGLGANRYVMINVLERGYRLSLAGCPPSHGRLVLHDIAGCDMEILLSCVEEGAMRLEITYRRGQWDPETLDRAVRDLQDCMARLASRPLDEPLNRAN